MQLETQNIGLAVLLKVSAAAEEEEGKLWAPNIEGRKMKIWLGKERERSRRGNFVFCEGAKEEEVEDYNGNGWAPHFSSHVTAFAICFRQSPLPLLSLGVVAPYPILQQREPPAVAGACLCLPGSRTWKWKDSF